MINLGSVAPLGKESRIAQTLALIAESGADDIALPSPVHNLRMNRGVAGTAAEHRREQSFQ